MDLARLGLLVTTCIFVPSGTGLVGLTKSCTYLSNLYYSPFIHNLCKIDKGLQKNLGIQSLMNLMIHGLD